MKIIKIFLAK